MRIALVILIAIHGMIHLFGFFKAFGLYEFQAISQPIPKTYGILWFLSFLFFAISVMLILVHSGYWWLSTFMAVILSQFLIINCWSDAKYGTTVNLMILFAAIIGYATFHFADRMERERISLFQHSSRKNQEIITEKALMGLPSIIQLWLKNSGIIGNKSIANVHLVQDLQLKIKPGQKGWYHAQAEQYFTIEPPAFSWNMSTEMNYKLSLVGRDKFEEGRGEMIIKLLSLIPVANAKNNDKIDQATLHRYLAEIVWFPSAALNQYIKWEAIDNYSAMATMEYKGTKGSGRFYFDKDGNFQKFVAMRYQDSNAKEPVKWTVTAKKTEKRNGMKIPVECEASWELENGNWTWLKLKITDIQYDLLEIQK